MSRENQLVTSRAAHLSTLSTIHFMARFTVHRSSYSHTVDNVRWRRQWHVFDIDTSWWRVATKRPRQWGPGCSLCWCRPVRGRVAGRVASVYRAVRTTWVHWRRWQRPWWWMERHSSGSCRRSNLQVEQQVEHNQSASRTQSDYK